MTTEQYTVVSLVIGVLTLIVGWLVYRLARAGGVSKVQAKWTTPIQIPITNGKTSLYCIVEGLLTNNGSKSVSLVRLVGENETFVRTEKLVIGERITSSKYMPRPRIFYLNGSMEEFCTEEGLKKVNTAPEIKHETFMLNEPIQSGHSHVLLLAFVFENYQREERKGMNTIIGFSCEFNNGQTEKLNLIMDGTLIPRELAIRKSGYQPK